ncbi:MAG: YbjN domain-containing protein [Lachnospiraceae bacterium]|nr:YbjN domain-containing protein [Lachnospiraceae bacterium]
MNRAAQSYINTLQKNDIKVKETFETEKGQTVVKCGWNLSTTKIDILVVFPEDCKYAEIRCFNFAKVPKDRLGHALIACNELNKKYKWVKFYVDEDGDITAEDDAIIDVATCGDECFELMIRMTQIVNESYPVVMKAIYG